MRPPWHTTLTPHEEAVIALLGSGPKQSGEDFYHDAGLDQRGFTERVMVFKSTKRLMVKDDPLREDLRKEIHRLMCSAGLTDTQQEVCLLRLDGHSFTDIGVLREHSRQGAMNIWVRAVAKIREAFASDPYAQWFDVYRSEASRRGKWF